MRCLGQGMWCPYENTEKPATEAFRWSLKNSLPSRRNGTPGQAGHQALCRRREVWGWSLGERGPSGSRLLPFSPERDWTAARQGQPLGKGFGNWNLWAFLLTERWEGERLILETSHFNQMRADGELDVRFLFWPFTYGSNTVPQGAGEEPWHRHSIEHRGMERFPLMSRVSKATTIKPTKTRNKTTWPVARLLLVTRLLVTPTPLPCTGSLTPYCVNNLKTT